MFLLAFAESIQLVPDGTLIVHIAIILIMIYVLNRTLFRPINRIIQSRESHKGGSLGEAGSILAEVSEKEAAYNKGMLDARSEGYQMIEREHSAAVAAREERLGSVKNEVSGKVSTDKQEIERQAAEAKKLIEQEADMIADKISASILKA